MRNILAITGKELRSYFASPVAYILLGLFAFLFGQFYTAYVGWFLEEAGQMFGPGRTANVNQQVISGLLQNSSVIILFMMPMITMRTYAEEKRSGTMELLLTSPVTDVQIITGKFLGAMGLYAALLGVTLFYVALLFFFGNPEWRPIVVGYLGLLLMGGCFIAFGLLISSATKNQIVAGVGTFAMFLALWIIDWRADKAGPVTRSVLEHLSITRHFSDFARGILDTTHIVYYLSVITLGLFLTAKSVDTERWRG